MLCLVISYCYLLLSLFHSTSRADAKFECSPLRKFGGMEPGTVFSCQCNGMVKCVHICACVRSKTPCSSCVPGNTANCHYHCTHSSEVTPPPSLASGSASQVGFTRPSQASPRQNDSNSTTPSPPTSASCSYRAATPYRHPFPLFSTCPKGRGTVRPKSSVSECLLSVCSDRVNIPGWSKIFITAKSLLASLTAGHHLRLRDILKLVKPPPGQVGYGGCG